MSSRVTCFRTRLLREAARLAGDTNPVPPRYARHRPARTHVRALGLGASAGRQLPLKSLCPPIGSVRKSHSPPWMIWKKNISEVIQSVCIIRMLTAVAQLTVGHMVVTAATYPRDGEESDDRGIELCSVVSIGDGDDGQSVTLQPFVCKCPSTNSA